jgi:predicted nucleic acid-binding protein
MVLVDTSIWVDHLRKGNRHLVHLLEDGEVVCHSFIIGELACGNINNRTEILTLLKSLPTTPKIDLDEYLYFMEKNHLFGFGIGFVDIHLLASAKLVNIPIWTKDKKLQEVAITLKVSYR